MFKRLRKWWLCRKYGVCPIHLTLAKGVYDCYSGWTWFCERCHEENNVKNEDFRSSASRNLERIKAQEEVLKIELSKRLERYENREEGK